jgi:hypothetical protein
VLIRLLPALGAAVLLGLAAHALSSHASQGVPLLPDLDQEAPSNLVVSVTGPRQKPQYILGFRSAVRNVGAGPLIVTGHRPDRGMDTMVADQQIMLRDGPAAVVRRVGRLRYVVSPDHRHWHLLAFERYELRTADGATVRRRDRKTGFCLGDRFSVGDRQLAARAPRPVYTSRCGLGEPARLGITEGISVGFGDDYQANLEGQYLPLGRLPAGRYVLVHRVDAARRLHQLDRSNDAASLLLRLRWRRGVPYVRVLAVCPDSAQCTR